MNEAGRPRLVFLISIARSGSTLLQKILASHPDVATVGEPWLLLPLAHLDRDHGLEAIYDHRTAARAIREMIERLPQGRATYVAHLRRFCLDIFHDLAASRPVFIDKDPRYYLILDFLAELFPQARFIFLFRNPLDVMCSMMSTWLCGRLLLHAYHIDLYEGVRAMARGARQYSSQSASVHYAQLVQEPAREVERICEFIGIDYRPQMLEQYRTVELGGSMGDPTAAAKYAGIARGSASVWPTRLNNSYRIRFARKYLATLGDEILVPWGFSRAEFEATVRQMKVGWRGSLRDLLCRHASDLWRRINGSRLRRAWQRRRHQQVFLFR
jgi:hypothetical protein